MFKGCILRILRFHSSTDITAPHTTPGVQKVGTFSTGQTTFGWTTWDLDENILRQDRRNLVLLLDTSSNHYGYIIQGLLSKMFNFPKYMKIQYASQCVWDIQDSIYYLMLIGHIVEWLLVTLPNDHWTSCPIYTRQTLHHWYRTPQMTTMIHNNSVESIT